MQAPQSLNGFSHAIRPTQFSEFIGQEKIKENLSIQIDAAKRRGEPVEHMLFYGPPGLGKTSLAHLVAREMGTSIRVTSGPAIERAGDLAAILTNLEGLDVLFIDEIHRLNRTIEEVLYPAMEDFVLDIIIGKGPSAKSVRLDLKKFTLIGATTRIGLLSSPLRDRFGMIYRLEFYAEAEIKKMLKAQAAILATQLQETALHQIAKRARGTPRIAGRLLRRVRDYAEVKGTNLISAAVADEALGNMAVDELGLDQIDRKVLSTLIEKFNGGPVGIDTLSAAIHEDPTTLEDMVEPFLLQLGFLTRTARGRVATPQAYLHLGLTPPTTDPEPKQQTIWEEVEGTPS